MEIDLREFNKTRRNKILDKRSIWIAMIFKMCFNKTKITGPGSKKDIFCALARTGFCLTEQAYRRGGSLLLSNITLLLFNHNVMKKRN